MTDASRISSKRSMKRKFSLKVSLLICQHLVNFPHFLFPLGNMKPSSRNLASGMSTVSSTTWLPSALRALAALSGPARTTMVTSSPMS